MNSTCAVVGLGESTYYRAGRSPHTAIQLASIAIRSAVEDAGLSMSDIDGLVTFNRPGVLAANLASWLGFGDLRFCAEPMSGGGNLGAAAVNLADAAVSAGYAKNVVVYRALNQGNEGRYGRARSTARATDESAYRHPFGLAAPVTYNAILSTRFMHKYHIDQDALANIALASYAHAQNNPRAVMYGKPLTREVYYESRWIAEPFHLYDCCQENDGACAAIVTTSERARDLRRPPAYILAGASGMEPKNGYWAFNDDAYPNGRYRSVGEQLWKRAGIRPTDIDVVQFYENFTGTTLMAIADIGFCEPADLNEFLTEERMMAPSGEFPFNTSGGNLAEAYIHGFELVNEAVRQVRGESSNQVPNVNLSLSVAGPGTPPSSAVLLGKSPE
jgi:acetyl-CoA acetyltransferase